jgi:iron complex transport system permease protein
MATHNALFLMLAIAALSIGVSLIVGHVPPQHELFHHVIVLIRLPHALTAFVTGGLLALAGAIMQVLVRNPLADPYVLGLSGGAAIVTLLLMLFGFSGYWLIGGAWLGSLCAIFLLFFLVKNTWHTAQLLLTGIAFASGTSALISLILFLSPDRTLRGMLFWLTGDLSDARLPVIEGSILFIGLLIGLKLAPTLNILIRGDKEAQALGVNTTRLHWKLYLLSSLLTATAVTLAGCIGFVGLIVPHVLRLSCGYDHRVLLPGCVLCGGSLLTLADWLSRTIVFPQALPIGVVMALMGIPVFLFLLQKNPT